jgi:hypothetical protein
MRELRYLGPGEDGHVIVETLDGGKQFNLGVNDQLRAALQPAAPPAVATAPTAGGEEAMTDIRPRDIQMRVRAGEDPQLLADEAGVPLEKIMRFAYPVLQERIRVVDEARRGRSRAGNDGHMLAFGEQFDHRVASLGTEPTSVGWDAFRRPDGGWTVTADFSARADSGQLTTLVAKFSFALLNRTVSALNDVAADLLAGGPVAALYPTPPPSPLAQPTAPAPAQAPQGPGLSPDQGQLQSPNGQQPGSRLAVVPGQPPHEGRSPLRLPSRRQKAHTHPLPVAVDDEMLDDLFDQEAVDPSGAGWHEPPLPLDLGPAIAVTRPGGVDHSTTDQTTTAAANTAAAYTAGSNASATGTAPTSDVVPDAREQAALSFESAPHDGEDPPAKRSGRAGDKPRMPSWDDILLGVRRRSE